MKSLKDCNINELKDRVKHHHEKITIKSSSLLKHAYKCGKLLLEIKKRLGHGEWQPWLKKNFNDSYPTLSVYMRVAKNWKKPIIQQSLQNGLLTSIKAFLDVLNKDTDPKDKLSDQDYQENINYLCKIFKNHIKNMSHKEIAELTKKFDDYIWPRLYKKIKHYLAVKGNK